MRTSTFDRCVRLALAASPATLGHIPYLCRACEVSVARRMPVRHAALLHAMATTLGARLNLHGPDADIVLNKAVITASCMSAERPMIRSMHPMEIRVSPGAMTTVRLINVADSCIDRHLTEPCISHDEEEEPALFFCHWTGWNGTVQMPPVHAKAKEVTFPRGDIIGYQPYVSCLLPDYNEMFTIGGAIPTYLNLSITQCAPASLPFAPARCSLTPCPCV